MPVDTDTNTKSHLGALPPELLSKIFCYLADRPHVDVANLRLVCRSFVPISSPFLITTAVVADRLDTLEKLQTLLRHPYFSKYITHLVYDVSTYDETLATNPEEFASRTNKSFRTYHRHDINSVVRSDRARLSALLEDSRNPSQDQSPDSSQDADSERSSPEDDDVGWDGPRVIDQAREHALKQARGYTEYCRRVIAQTALRERRVVSQYFCLAFDRFPRLRHLSFADFRSLSRNGESYNQLCWRLFGGTLCPELLINRDAMFSGFSFSRRDGDNLYSWQCGAGVLHDLRNTYSTLPHPVSLSFGANNFRTSSALDALETPLLPLTSSQDPKDNACNPLPQWNPLPRSLQDEIEWPELPQPLRSLRLPLDIRSSDAVEGRPGQSLNGVFKRMTGTLEDLELVTVAYNGVKQYSLQLEARLSDLWPILSDTFAGLVFEILRSVTLSGWMFHLRPFQCFLTDHASTLRELRMIRCICDESYSAFFDMAENGLASLRLTGVEIYAMRFWPDFTAEEKVVDSRRPNPLRHSAQPPEDWASNWSWAMMCGDLEWPYRQYELEVAMLQGRSNSVRRRRVENDNAAETFSEHVDWWKQPNFF